MVVKAVALVGVLEVTNERRTLVGKKKPKPIVREVIWTKRLRKVIG